MTSQDRKDYSEYFQSLFIWLNTDNMPSSTHPFVQQAYAKHCSPGHWAVVWSEWDSESATKGRRTCTHTTSENTIGNTTSKRFP